MLDSDSILPTVTLRNSQGSEVTVNALEDDEAYQLFTRKGYVLADSDKPRLKPSKFDSKTAELLWRIAELESELRKAQTRA